MYKYYCIKAYLDNGESGYYWGADAGKAYLTQDINSSAFYDTADDAYEAYRRIFYSKGYTVNGHGISRCTVVEVTSANPI